jgi:RNA polymerase sigma factor (sigma-70 family)
LLGNFDGIEAAKELFWEILGYDRCNDPLPPRFFPPAVRPLVGDVTVFAEHDGFCVIFARLAQEDFHGKAVGGIVRGALKRFPFAAFLVTDLGHVHWRFVCAGFGGNPLSPKPTLAHFHLTGPNVDYHRTTNRLLRLRTYDHHDEPVSYVQLSEAYQQVFGLAKSCWEPLQEPRQDGLALYLRDVARIPMLARQEELAIVRELDACGPVDRQCRPLQRRVLPDKQAEYVRYRNALVAANLRLCLFIAKRFRTEHLDWTDLAQEAALGLLRAAELMDPARGTRYITYAYRWAEQYIRRAICNEDSLIRVPPHVLGNRKKYFPGGRQPRVLELTAAVAERVSVARAPTRCSDLLLELQLALESGVIRERLRDALKRLPYRQREIIKLRYGLGDGYSYTWTFAN